MADALLFFVQDHTEIRHFDAFERDRVELVIRFTGERYWFDVESTLQDVGDGKTLRPVDIASGSPGRWRLREPAEAFMPMSQQDWAFFNASGGHDFSYVFDTGSSRVMARQEATQSPTRISQIRRRIILPRNFERFEKTALRFIVRGSASLPVRHELTLLKNGVADPNIDGLDIIASAGSTFEARSATPEGTYRLGDFITLEVEVETTTNGEFGEFGDLQFKYKTLSNK